MDRGVGGGRIAHRGLKKGIETLQSRVETPRKRGR